jgi:hypothetical protein
LEECLKNNKVELPTDLPIAKQLNIPTELGAQMPSMSEEL